MVIRAPRLLRVLPCLSLTRPVVRIPLSLTVVRVLLTRVRVRIPVLPMVPLMTFRVVIRVPVSLVLRLDPSPVVLVSDWVVSLRLPWTPPSWLLTIPSIGPQ